jgi:hypothetical protein
MTRPFALAMAVLCLVHLASGGPPIFTPTIDPIPDVVGADQTPVSGLTPEEISSPEDTFESQPADADIFDFPDALDLFALVQGGGSTPDEISDEALIYEFISSPSAPGTGVYTTPTATDPDDRISINGVRIGSVNATSPSFTDVSSAVDAAGGLLSFKDEALSSDADGNTPFTTVDPAFTYAFGPANHPAYAGPFQGLVTAPLIDANMLTLLVTNPSLPVGADQARRDFAVFTVDDGPDATSGGLVISDGFVDLSAWAFDALLNQDIGSTIVADWGIFSESIPDITDGSNANLRMGSQLIRGNSFMTWGSPPDEILFEEGGTYRTTWEVNSTGFAHAATNTPVQRFRALYGFFGGLGVNDLHVEGFVAPPPVGGTLVYHHIFDHFDGIASANSMLLIGFGDFSGFLSTENWFRLLWDWVDLIDTIADDDGGGTLELDSLVIERLDRDALRAQMSTVVDIDDFQQGVQVDLSAPFDSSTATMVAVFPTADDTPITITSTGAAAPGGTQPFTFGGAGGIPFPLDVGSIGSIPVAVPANPDTRIYRGQATVTPLAEDVPLIRVNIKSFEVFPPPTLPWARLTAETIVNAMRQSSEPGGSGTNEPNPALTVRAPSDFSSYLELPRDLSFGPGPGVGNAVAVSVDVLDFDIPYVSGGEIPVTVQVNRLLLESGPPGLLP